MEEHDILISSIKKLQSDFYNSYKITRKRNFLKKTKDLPKKQQLFPRFCYRTADLLVEINKLLEGHPHAKQLIFECFGKCTLTTFYYINLDDLIFLIQYHKEHNVWRVKLS